MRTLSFRVRLSSLAVFVAVLNLGPAIVRADTAQAPATESSAGGATDTWLVARGLIGHGMIGERSSRDAMTPPSGVRYSRT